MKWIGILEKAIISVCLTMAVLIMFANVVARYLFETGFTWSLELIQYLTAWSVLVGAAYAVKSGAHLGVDVLVNLLSARYKKILIWIAFSAFMLFAVWTFFLSVEYTYKIYAWGDLSLDLEIPQWIPYMAIPVGLSLMILHLVELGISLFKGETDTLHASEATQALKDKPLDFEKTS